MSRRNFTKKERLAVFAQAKGLGLRHVPDDPEIQVSTLAVINKDDQTLKAEQTVRQL